MTVSKQDLGRRAWELFSATADDLRQWFSEYGEVTKAQITTDRETGQSRGFGFVEMSSGGDVPYESFSLNFLTMSFKYRISGGATTTVNWNLSTNS